MSLSAALDQLHYKARSNRWMVYFSIALRIGLGFGFILPSIPKLMGERFTVLSNNHPMGHYLEALHHTGYYYTFIGIGQLVAGILLLIPRTVTLGALLYLPIILNICVLSYAVRFEGSILTSPLMTLGILFLLCWNYDKLKYILPFNHSAIPATHPKPETLSNQFPIKFFLGVFATVVLVLLNIRFGFDVMPRNTTKDCLSQFKGSNRTQAGAQFCNCIHKQGMPLDEALAQYRKAPDDTVVVK